MTSWISHCCTLGVIFVGQPLPGRFTTVPSLIHLWIMALTVIRWSPKALDMALEPFPDWHMSTILFLICSWISLVCCIMCCSSSMLHFVRQILFKWFLDSTGLAVIRAACGLWNLTPLYKIMCLITVLSWFNGRGQFIFHVGPGRFGQLFSLNKWNYYLKADFVFTCIISV